MNIYFDNAATTKVRDEVIDQISDILKDCFGNPSSTHSYGRSAKSYIEISTIVGTKRDIRGFKAQNNNSACYNCCYIYVCWK